MNMTAYRSSPLRSALIATAVAFGFGMAHGATDDAAITARVKAKMVGESALERSHISVTTTDGVVTLGGSASSSAAKSAAEATAKAVEGVKSVDNNLKTPAATQAAGATHDAISKTERVGSDSWITTKVKSEILASSLAKGFEVKVRTTHGVVVLRGVLASQDAVDEVKNIARKVDGVKSIDASALKIAS